MLVHYDVVLFRPGVNPEVWCADVYTRDVEGRLTRVHCGPGCNSLVEAYKSAENFLATAVLVS